MADTRHDSAADTPSISLPVAILLVVVFAAWGAQQAAIKIGNADMPPVFQAGLRSIGAASLLAIWFLWRGERPWCVDVHWLSILGLGVLFTLDFGLLFIGLDRTSASRGSILYYAAPFMIALGAHVVLPGERLARTGILGFVMALAGACLVLLSRQGASFTGDLVGDLLCLGAAAAWAATILFVKATDLSRTSAAAVLFYQLAGSALLLPILSRSIGEPWSLPTQPAAIAALGFQIVVVAFASYLAFFWMLKHHPASRLSAFSFLTPVFGVLFGVILLGETITMVFGIGAVLVVAGIGLVNKSHGHRS